MFKSRSVLPIVSTGRDHRLYNDLYLGPNCTTANIPPTISQAQAIQTAISWIANCMDHHSKCTNETPKGTSYPTRLVEVGQNEDFSDVKLCKSTEIGKVTRYVTLSHCWGPKGLSYKLLEANIVDFGLQLPWSGMPKTFKDAIFFTRKLRDLFGVNYIWIDALCIVQDSKEDWQRESSIMGDIYAQSFCDLAACIGTDSEGGLFSQREPFASHVCQVIAGSGSILGKYASSAMAHFTVEDREGYESEVGSSALLSRAWVLQELRLSPRILYFTRQKLYWGCPDLCANEKRPSKSLPELSKLSQWHMFDMKDRMTKRNFKDLETVSSGRNLVNETELSQGNFIHGQDCSDDEENITDEDDRESAGDFERKSSI